MGLIIRNSSDMQWDEVAKHGREITRCLTRLVERFPEEATLQSAFDDIMAGRRQLWLIIDDETDVVVMIQLTEICTNLITGKTFVRCVNTGGAGIDDALPLLDEIEVWAKSIGAEKIEGVGRQAWVRLLKPRGYELSSVTLTKRL
jgi:hypothetical protein